jgi:hypothetical protein
MFPLVASGMMLNTSLRLEHAVENRSLLSSCESDVESPRKSKMKNKGAKSYLKRDQKIMNREKN